MSKTVLTLLLFLPICGLSLSAPKEIWGTYEATVHSFEFENNGKVHTASSYKVKVILRENYMDYFCGRLKMRGSYDEVEKQDGVTQLNISVSNDASIEFNLKISVDKKGKQIKLWGLTGVPETEMVKRQIVIQRKN